MLLFCILGKYIDFLVFGKDAGLGNGAVYAVLCKSIGLNTLSFGKDIGNLGLFGLVNSPLITF